MFPYGTYFFYKYIRIRVFTLKILLLLLFMHRLWLTYRYLKFELQINDVFYPQKLKSLKFEHTVVDRCINSSNYNFEFNIPSLILFWRLLSIESCSNLEVLLFITYCFLYFIKFIPFFMYL